MKNEGLAQFDRFLTPTNSPSPTHRLIEPTSAWSALGAAFSTDWELTAPEVALDSPRASLVVALLKVIGVSATDWIGIFWGYI